ncbi:iron-siderophore ABC transporter substrate-binding protein [Patulibacter sp.]|uniref:iron-siderophore ABC transporter substrate-binding protein n=1 Tax=Patulibacter sp. TaxID=1912859 RepID=UPI00271D5098|nr:iron-siderophore ABC transporter substrate-binding protein [Patulibacter sp.]MDO9410457.1 iron-siderophore ABC transporter substrate-binding protein [Patulibacter sp.]
MRRLGLLPLLLATVTLAACGGSDDDSTPATAGTGTTAARATDGFPVTVTHARGTTEIPSEPKRVVTVGLRDQDTLLALGVKAVGAMDWFQQDTFAKWPWEDWGGTPPEIVSTGGFEVNFERVAAARPDLILGVYQDISKGDYEKLSQIAPTVAQSPKYKAYTTPWREETRTIAKSVGRTAAADRLIEDVDARFQKVREEHPEYRGKEAVVVDPSSTYAFSSTDPRGQFLKELGFAGSPSIDKLAKGEFGLSLSDEQLTALDVDKLFLLVDAKGGEKVLDNPLFKRLDVVKRGDVVKVPYYDKPQTGAAIAFNSVLSLPYAIDGTVKLITENEAQKQAQR